MREVDGVVAGAGDAGGIVFDIDDGWEPLDVARVSGAEEIEKVAVVDRCPLQTRLLQGFVLRNFGTR